jgi:hypothetical protein
MLVAFFFSVGNQSTVGMKEDADGTLFSINQIDRVPSSFLENTPRNDFQLLLPPEERKKKLFPRFSILAISKFHVIYEKSIQEQISMAGSYSHGTWLVTGPRVVSSVSLRTKERSKAKISCSAAEKTLDMEAKKSTDYRCGKKKKLAS